MCVLLGVGHLGSGGAMEKQMFGLSERAKCEINKSVIYIANSVSVMMHNVSV